MPTELLEILSQFGGGRGDPGNNAVRFVLAAAFWAVLLSVALRRWRRDREKRDCLVGVAAAVGLTREAVMFLLEYGTFRGFIPNVLSYNVYPPLEHSLTGVARVLLGYAFLRYFLPDRKTPERFLAAGLACVAVLYAVTAPLWVRFLGDHREMYWQVSLRFADFWGETAFSAFGAAMAAAVILLLYLPFRRGRRVPPGIPVAFLLLFLDHFLMIVNIATGVEDGLALYSPVRNMLAIAAIPIFLGVYWNDLFQRLDEERARNLSILTGIGDGISIQGPDLKVLYQNPVHVGFTGNHVGEHCFRAYEGKEAPCEGCPVVLSMADGRTHTVERSVERPEGDLHVEITASPMRDAAGRIVAGIESVRDISGRKRLEDQFRHAQRMEAVGRLAGSVAHDFNNLLTAINGYGDLLLARIDPADPNRRHVEEIVGAGSRAAALTGQLLAFSRRQPTRQVAMEPAAVVSGMETMLRRLIGESVDLRIEAPPGAGQVLADEGEIGQVVMNLAVNARDAMPRGGRLSIGVDGFDADEPVVHDLGVVPPGRYIRLAVRDTGHGMGGEVLSHLFEPFFTTKGKGKGTGLGLSTVYGIVGRDGGHVGVDSAPGKGTVVSVYLPRAPEGAMAPEKEPSRTAAAGGTETVLVAEDEENVRELARQVLAEKGYNVLAAGNGAEALSMLAGLSAPPNLLLTDVVMPGMNGFDLAERFRRVCREARVVYMSGYPDSEILPHGTLSAGAHFLQKPFNAEMLARKTREALDAPVPSEPMVSGP
ncbi:MAG: response regulator [Deltaproteobacteria bacterium]|nr:response regulator [Deltaproteobacteria bacterium]